MDLNWSMLKAQGLTDIPKEGGVRKRQRKENAAPFHEERFDDWYEELILYQAYLEDCGEEY